MGVDLRRVALFEHDGAILGGATASLGGALVEGLVEGATPNLRAADGGDGGRLGGGAAAGAALLLFTTFGEFP